MTTRVSPGQLTALMAGAIIVAGVLAYSNTFRNEFVWDDASSVQLHKHVQDPSQFPQLFKEDLHAFGRGQGNFYRPLVAASFMLDFALARRAGLSVDASGVPQVSPFLFHRTNLFWHMLAAFLLFALLTRLETPPALRIIVPLLYVVHPLHTEAVAYISGRADPMAAAFMFAALWFVVWDTTPRKVALGYGLSAVCFIAGLLCKESSAILPALLFLVALLRPVPESAAKFKCYALRMIPVFVSLSILGLYGYLRFTVLDFASPGAQTAAPLWERAIAAGQALALYLSLLFVPVGLHMERTLDGIPVWVASVGLAVLLACMGVVIRGIQYRQYRLVLGVAWFLVTWFPISGLIPLNAPMAEHWLYVPLAGLLWAFGELGALVLRSARSQRVALAAVYGLSVWYFAVTVTRNRDWRDNETLYRATLAENPNSLRVQFNLAVTYQDLLNNVPGARRHFEKLLEAAAGHKKRVGIAPENLLDEELEAHLALGDIYFDLKQYRKAGEHYANVLRVVPTEANKSLVGAATLSLGRCSLALGDSARAALAFQQLLKAQPEMQIAVDQLLGSPGPI